MHARKRATVSRVSWCRFPSRWAGDFVCSDADQGLFSHVYLVLQQMRSFALTNPRQKSEYVVHHFWGPSKPWKTWASTRACPLYFDFLHTTHATATFNHPETPCTTLLQRASKHIEQAEMRRKQVARAQMKAAQVTGTTKATALALAKQARQVRSSQCMGRAKQRVFQGSS